jgi:hypothetical protein
MCLVNVGIRVHGSRFKKVHGLSREACSHGQTGNYFVTLLPDIWYILRS